MSFKGYQELHFVFLLLGYADDDYDIYVKEIFKFYVFKGVFKGWLLEMFMSIT